MRLDRRTGQALLLLCLCAFMTWMWGSGETLRYLGPRTQWLVPFGAVTLAVLAFAAVQAARRDPAPEPLSRRDLAGLCALVLPVAMAMLLAHTQLGAQAASKKLASRGIDTSALADLAAGHAGKLDFLELSVAQRDSHFAAEHDIRPGAEVRLLGFVSRSAHARHGAFELSRFYITCCVADSIPIGVDVVPPLKGAVSVRKDRWLQVTGALVRRSGGHMQVQAAKVRAVPAPKHPYLYVATA